MAEVERGDEGEERDTVNADIYRIDTDAHEIVHIRRKDSGECVGCIESGLFWLIRALVLAAVDAPRKAAR